MNLQSEHQRLERGKITRLVSPILPPLTSLPSTGLFWRKIRHITQTPYKFWGGDYPREPL